MGSRGPVAKRARAARTAEGKRLRQLPDDADAIFRRLARDIAGLGLAKAEAERTPNEGLTVPDTAHGDGTEMRKNPLLIVLRTASEQIRANAQQLGASPLARARLPEKEAEQLSLADILFADVDAMKHG